MAKKSIDGDPEGYVKTYQLQMIENKLDSTKDTLDSIEKRMTDMVTLSQTRPTISQVEALIAAAELRQEKAVKDAIEKQDLKYAPIVGSNKWLLRLLVGGGVTMIISLVMIIVGLAGKQ